MTTFLKALGITFLCGLIGGSVIVAIHTFYNLFE